MINLIGTINSPTIINTKITGGLPGKTGKSAFEVWQALPGNENKTEQEFIDSLSENIMPEFLQEMRQVGDTSIIYSGLFVTSVDSPTKTTTINYYNQKVQFIEEFYKLDNITIKTTFIESQGQIVQIKKEVL